jgi:GntR family transcriptional repressor for pyruvate dehydrogenase complex
VNRVTDELRQMILSGDLQPGDFLPTRKELAAQFGVGLSTIHEAIQALSAVGMLESRPGKGTWVREDTLETLIHPTAVETRLGELNADKVYEARFVIEIALTELAAKRATPEDVECIRSAIEAMEATMDDDEAFVEADLEFHLAVAQAGRNELLEQFYHISRKLLVTVISEMVKLPHVKEDALHIQRDTAEAIAGGDSDRAREVAIEHMKHVRDILDTWEHSEKVSKAMNNLKKGEKQ